MKKVSFFFSIFTPEIRKVMNVKQPFSSIAFYRAAAFIALAALLYSCANMARPGGGPYDETPPVFITSTPASGALNIDKQKIEIVFDEIVLVDKPSEKVVVSPPQKEMPEIRASGHKVTVTLNDSLLPNTTYTIDFSDAITDNNERNPLYGFSYSFSTGENIDSLQISGILLNASDLEPITGMLVGIHSSMEDTAFQKIPLERIATSNDLGQFTIRNIAPGSYRLFALKDLNRDFQFDNPTEDIAFLDSLVVPSFEVHQHIDTLWVDSVTIDTIIEYPRTHFYPNNILLTAFNEGFKHQYIDKTERANRRRLDIYFTAPADSLPRLKPLNFEQKDWAIIEHSAQMDTLQYWIKDSLIYNVDTLLFAAEYLRTDSLRQLSLYNDTLKFIMKTSRNKKNEKKEEKKKKKEEEKNDSIEVPEIKFLKINSLTGSTLDIYKPLRFSFEEPLLEYDRAKLHLEQKRDTLWIPIADSLFTVERDSIAIRNYTLTYKWAPGTSYRFVADSIAFTGIYGLFTKPHSQEFKVKSLEEYSNLYIEVIGVTDSAFVEILNTSDNPIRTAPVVNGGAEFMYMAPGTYYARLFIDKNHNGKYDTGNYAERRQPEEVSYYPQELVLKANWDIEQTWDVYATPVDRQKPAKIKKNKPKEKKKKQRPNR